MRSLAARNVDCDTYAQLSAGTGAEIGFSSSPPSGTQTAPKKKIPVVTVK